MSATQAAPEYPAGSVQVLTNASPEFFRKLDSLPGKLPVQCRPLLEHSLTMRIDMPQRHEVVIH